MSWKIEKSNYKILVRLFLTKRHSFVTKIKRKKWKILVFIMYFSIIFEDLIYPNEKIRKILKKVLTIKINCDILIEYLWVKKQQQILINALVAKSVDAQDLKSCGNLSRAGSSPARGTTKSYYAGVAQLVERQPSKLNVASSTLVSRSKIWAISSVGRALDF